MIYASTQQPNEEPPLLFIWIVGFTLALIVLFLGLNWARETNIDLEIPFNRLFLEAKGEPIDYLQFSGDYLLSQAPPFLVEGETLATLVEKEFDEDLYNRMIGCESKDDPTARNPKSSAYGVCQMINGTWRYVQEKWGMKLDRYSYYDQHYACRRLMQEEGMSHWEESKYCWNK